MTTQEECRKKMEVQTSLNPVNMPLFRGIQCQLVSEYGGLELPEYAPPRQLPSDVPLSIKVEYRLMNEDGRVITLYVPVSPGTRFWIKYSIPEPAGDPVKFYVFRLSINGQVLSTWATGERDEFKGKVMFVLCQDKGSSDRIRTQTLAFGSQEPTKRDIINISVFRSLGRKPVPVPKEALVPTDKSGNAIKGDGKDSFSGPEKGSSIQLKKGCLIPTDHPQYYYANVLLDPIDKPYAVFQFIPRTEEQLALIGPQDRKLADTFSLSPYRASKDTLVIQGNNRTGKESETIELSGLKISENPLSIAPPEFHLKSPDKIPRSSIRSSEKQVLNFEATGLSSAHEQLTSTSGPRAPIYEHAGGSVSKHHLPAFECSTSVYLPHSPDLQSKHESGYSRMVSPPPDWPLPPTRLPSPDFTSRIAELEDTSFRQHGHLGQPAVEPSRYPTPAPQEDSPTRRPVGFNPHALATRPEPHKSDFSDSGRLSPEFHAITTPGDYPHYDPSWFTKPAPKKGPVPNFSRPIRKPPATPRQIPNFSRPLPNVNKPLLREPAEELKHPMTEKPKLEVPKPKRSLNLSEVPQKYTPRLRSSSETASGEKKHIGADDVKTMFPFWKSKPKAKNPLEEFDFGFDKLDEEQPDQRAGLGTPDSSKKKPKKSVFSPSGMRSTSSASPLPKGERLDSVNQKEKKIPKGLKEKGSSRSLKGLKGAMGFGDDS